MLVVRLFVVCCLLFVVCLFVVCCLLFGVCCFFSLLFALCALLLKNYVWVAILDVPRKLFGQVGEDVHFVVIKLNIVEVLQD